MKSGRDNRMIRLTGLVSLVIPFLVCSTHDRASAQRSRLATEPELARDLLTKARKTLEKKKIPFDPNIVLHEDWKERIDPALWDLPEMKENKRVNQPLEGVYVANLLMVGEEIKLKGDTVLLIKELAPDNENRDLKISGKGDFFMFLVGKDKRIRLTGLRGRIMVFTADRCFAAGVPQGYTFVMACGRKGIFLPDRP